MLKSSEVLNGNFPASRRFSSGHNGIDLKSPNGVIVKARYPGKILTTGTNPPGKDFGNYIRMRYDNSVVDGWYAHLKSFKVKAGQKVSKSQTISLSNNTGLSTGPHLHYSESTGNIKWLNPDNTNVKEVEELYKGKNAKTWYDAYVKYSTAYTKVKKYLAARDATISKLNTLIEQQAAQVKTLAGQVNGLQDDLKIAGKEIEAQRTAMAEMEGKVVTLDEKLKMATAAPDSPLDPKDDEGWTWDIVSKFFRDMFKKRIF